MEEKKNDLLELSNLETKIVDNTNKNLDSLKEIYKIDEFDTPTTQEVVKARAANTLTDIVKVKTDEMDKLKTPLFTKTPQEIDKNKPWRKFIRRKIGDG